MSVLFAADLTENIRRAFYFTPSNDVSRNYDVYDLYLGTHPSGTYWTEWGGYYDTPVVNQIELYIDSQFLVGCILYPTAVTPLTVFMTRQQPELFISMFQSILGYTIITL
jgi:hypothetical protein